MKPQGTPLTDDVIVYTLVTDGGGIDGRDHTDKGGKVLAASFHKNDLLRHGSAPWCHIDKQVIDLRERERQALAKLDPIDKLILGIS